METQTIVIDNFTGSLTRRRIGMLNSGLAYFDTSWGYNPFAEPGSLTWNSDPNDITQSLDGLLIAGKTRVESGINYLYGITNSAHFVKIKTSDDTITDLHTFSTGTPTFKFGSSLDFYNGKVWITNDKGVSRIDFDGTNETQVGSWDSSHFIQNTYHPLIDFEGKLYVGNTTDGTSTNIGEIDSTNLITNYSRLSPALPTGTYVRDMDVTSDFSYMLISASFIPQEDYTPATPPSNAVNSYAGDSFLFKWNGTDIGISAGISLPNFGITALNSFGQSEYSFMYDILGSALYEGGRKLLTLPANKSPLPNASASSGNFLVWAVPESGDITSTRLTSSVNYYGNLDSENPVGLWRMVRSYSDGFLVNNIPFALFVQNQNTTVTSLAAFTSIPNKIYFSEQAVDTGGTITNYLNSFTVSTNPRAALSVVPAYGATWTSQSQLFKKKVTVGEIRVYCDETVAGNKFQINLLDQSSDPVNSNVMTYEYAAGTDITKLQGQLTRINFNPVTPRLMGVGIEIINLSTTTNMRIRKVEIDISPAGQ